MVNNEIFEIENEEEIEEVEGIGKCCICGRDITDDEDDYCNVYNPGNDDYELLCGECQEKGGNFNYSYCTHCYGWACVRKDSESIEAWDINTIGRLKKVEKFCGCKEFIEESGLFEKCEKCGTYCLTSLLEETGLCPDCEEAAEEDED